MAKREITPHKGGRTEQLKILLTPKLRKMVDDIKAKTGDSNNDTFERLFKAEWEKLFSGQMSIPESAYREVGKSETE